MSNGDPEPLPDDDLSGETEAPTRVSKARAVKKKKTKKRTSKTAVAQAPASDAVGKGAAVKSTAGKGTPAKRPKRTSGGHTRVQLGSTEMFVSREMAEALTAKDLRRLKAIFKRARKHAQKAAKKKR
jgi:hypothetical protein